MKTITTLLAVLALASFEASESHRILPSSDSIRSQEMNLGAFSISLTVKDLAKSRAFYKKLGFEKVGGKAEQNWLILRNGESTIGLFHDMFEKNALTFNPGWSGMGEHPEEFMDVREIQKKLKEAGLELTTEADESTKGPASLTLLDPDENPVYIDQHR